MLEKSKTEGNFIYSLHNINGFTLFMYEPNNTIKKIK